MKIRIRSLELRITVLFLLMIFIVQMAGFVLIRTGIEKNARAALRSELALGEKVFVRLLEQRAQTLTEGAQLLAADYGFREAIGTDDKDTIASALSNQGERIGASLAMLVSPTHELKAYTGGMANASLEKLAVALVQRAEQAGSASRVTVVANTPFQTIAVPVKAPATIGWVVMAFPIDKDIGRDMLELSSLHLTILSRSNSTSWVRNLTTHDAVSADIVMRNLGSLATNRAVVSEMEIDEREYSTRILPIGENDGQTSIAVLQRSVSEAIETYRQLQMTLLILTAVGIAIAGVASAVTAKRITGPLRELADNAKRLGAGDYTLPVNIDKDDEIGELSRAFENMRNDIASREAEVGRLAYWDQLTDLPNRAQFTNLLNAAIVSANQNETECHVLMMDLDRFKHVNDVLGHSFGDALLKQVAERLRGLTRRGDGGIARLGGDEFALLLTDTSVVEAKGFANRILKALEVPISLDGQTVDLGAGIGIAAFPAHGNDAESLLSRSEVAMYVAKKSGNQAVVYDPSFDNSSQQTLSLMSELRRAVDQGELRFYVQPKISLESGFMCGTEALVRWLHPERGMIPPDKFIPFAEKTGFIRFITAWMIEQAAMLQKSWCEQGIRLKISVNLSTRDLLDQDLPIKFMEVLNRHGVEPELFCLEITESAIMDDPVRALQTLHRLHAMGVDLSIDDFGTGYSSLAYLKRLPVNELKIDKSFVLNMERESNDVAIVRSTIDLGHNMGLRVVAEGVENKAVWNLLDKMGCDHGQGFFISRPMPAELLPQWITDWSASQIGAVRQSA